jgi:transcriptional regulator with GAF, ATPase, and Fis domain/tetratricopeptide (TPR) repeat protein
VPDADEDDVRAAAAALDAIADPWAAARASELHALAGARQEAEASALRAIGAVPDPSARADLWQRWERTLARLEDEHALPPLLRSVDVALHAGDVERAVLLGTQALARKPDAFGTLLALGRTNLARGDLPTASHWLGKALAVAGNSRALVEVELAELCHMEGDMEGARRHARSVVFADAATRLHARNVLGKILLAQKAWSDAETHFAADACEAVVAGDLSGELRARLNRAIAVLSAGRLEDARAMLREVLAEGEAGGEVRAVAYALTNLASIATLRREYVDALRLSERAFEARRRLGDKVTLALLITNMAELKLQLGMVAEAEQALAFGRHACGPAMPGSRASHFALTAAHVHLARGRTVEARAELKTALATAGGSPHGARLGECWRLAARVELEDGDRAAARVAIEHAARTAESPRERAHVSLCQALLSRASGEGFADAAKEALERAREAGDPELSREAHVLLHHAARLDGDARGARGHLDLAVALRDQVSDALPDDMRKRYLARRDLAELERLVVSSGAAPSSPPPREDGVDGLSAQEACSRSGSTRIETSAPQSSGLRKMVGRTPAMLALAAAVAKVGKSDATVLVHGESGTGKELVADAIHEASARRTGPLVKVNCAALVETLLLSELFGHEKGAFTGAAARRRGRFEVADGGTLFLDEIGDISPRTQVALLRVLQDKTFERVGGVTPIRADVRIVCATHRDLAAMVSRGEFREDLYYRLRGVVLEVPALRQRLADLPVLADAILDRIADERGTRPKRLSASALEGLARHPWPGNVRELENALRAAALFADGDRIELEDFTSNVEGMRILAPQIPVTTHASAGPITLSSHAMPRNLDDFDDGTDGASDDGMMPQPSKIAHSSSGEGGSATEVAYAAIRAGISLSELKRDIERDCIARALAETGGNITRAASLLGMKRPRLSQLVKQYGFGSSSANGTDAEGDAEEADNEAHG